MLVIPGQRGKDDCDRGVTRRELLQVGGSSMLGLSLAGMLRSEASGASGGVGFGKAKSVILVYLQGGPSHLDIWDPKENVPDNVKSSFKTIDTKVPGVQFTENLPKLKSVTPDVISFSFSPTHLVHPWTMLRKAPLSVLNSAVSTPSTADFSRAKSPLRLSMFRSAI